MLTDTSFHPFRSAEAKAEYHALYTERAKAWPVESETRFIETPSGVTFVRISGDSANPPLVLLPGSQGTSITWIPNIAALSQQYSTYALDSIYDFGLSVRGHNLRKPEDLVTWLDEVLAVLVPNSSASLMGLSYGGWLASQYAIHFPQRVHKIVLLAPAMTVLPVSSALIMRALLTLLPLPQFRKAFYYWLLRDAVQSGKRGKAYVDEAVSDWAVATRCFTRLPLIPATVLDDNALRHFSVPCLFLVGENEKMYSPQRAVERLNRIATQIRTHIIPSAGHDLWFTQADIFNKMILSFLDERG